MKWPKLLSIFLLFAFTQISFAQKIELVNSVEVIKAGIMLYDSGKYKLSINEFNKVNRSDTNYVWSLSQKALSCQADSQYTQAIKYCREGLALNEQREYEPELFNTFGNSLNDMGKSEDALKVFDQAIAKYPSYSLFYFNKGVVMMSLKRFADAEILFQKTLLINPYLNSAHFQLAVAALQQGKMIPGFLAVTGYLLANHQGKYWQNCINILSQITKGTDEMVQFKNKRTVPQDDNYQTVEDIVFSKIALDKAYKPITSLDDPISRQIQVVFEKLEYSSNDKDFEVQYYLPYFKHLYKDGKFEVFINYIFANANVKSIQEYNAKNKKEIEALENDASEYFNNIRSTRELYYAQRDSVKERYAFENGILIGKGVLTNKGKTLTGKWEFYFPVGNIKASGVFNEAGAKTGQWKFYQRSGRLDGVENHKDGKMDGLQEYYHGNGNLSSRQNYVAGQANGLVTTYYYSGTVKSTVIYKNDKKDGEEHKNYANGNLQAVNNYVNGVLNGPAREYYKSGTIKEVEQYVNGKLDGPYKLYHENGSVANEGVLAKDKAEGEWKYYYDSGKLKEKRNYINDNQDGLQQQFYENGQLSISYTSKKGKTVDEQINYFEDGKVSSRDLYENGILKSVKYFDKAGRQLSASNLHNNNVDVITYTADEIKGAHLAYNQDGKLNGPDTIFFPSGKINEINQYKDGVLNGLAISYYLNGKKKAEINMTDGKQDGYYTSFKVNGQPEVEGWIKDGENQGEWYTYNELGKVNMKTYYLDGDPSGYKEEFDPAGKKTTEEKYYHGWLEKLTQYDSTGKIMLVDTFPKSSGKYNLVYANGKPMIQADYVNGDFNGTYNTYYFDGSLESSTFFNKGLQDSIYISYYHGGNKYSEGRFMHGNKTGIWKFYDEDGKLSSNTPYVMDQINGERVYYSPDGSKDFESMYKDDLTDGLLKKYNPDGTMAYKIMFENDLAKAYSYMDKDGKWVPIIPISLSNGVLKTYFQNGKVARESAYSDGVKNGRDVFYFPNGQIRSEYAQAYGLYEGAYNEYYDNGKLKSEYHYVNDNINGICKDFDKSGALKKEVTYLNGMNHGPAKYYENGKLKKIMMYSYGKLLSVKNEQ